MPLVRYFVFVAGALLAMLSLVNWCLPAPPASNQDVPVDRTTLRIQSVRKWPQKIEFDTTIHPFVAPSAPVTPVVVAEPVSKPSLEALAQAKLADAPPAAPKPRVRKVRRVPRSPPPVRYAVNPTAPSWTFSW